ncbi:MAG TPA: hypothetical protein VGY58_12895 [Gemmataceae bacterium]|jgi:hypothetical protein|nr:hypothetical protein [Gemmataceae bacterium]
MQRRLELMIWTGVVSLLTAALPLFLCLPLWADATHYDLCARNLLRGGVLYRDLFDMNLPGMVWLHATVRSLAGWRSETLRVADMLVVTAVATLLFHWSKGKVARTARAGAALALYAFYFSLTEWCHCQRDVWMLVPALLALHLRRRQLERIALLKSSPIPLVAWSALEGLIWGFGIWIKPFVLVVCIASWFAGVLIVRRAWRGRIVMDGIGLIIGGLLIGGAGCAWLWHSGSLPYMCHIFLDWNPEYYRHPIGILTRSKLLCHALAPWCWLHFAAVPCAVIALGEAFRAGRAMQPDSVQGQRALLSAFYLAWLLQAAYLQQPFDYVLAPAICIAIALVAQFKWLPESPRLRWAIVTAFAVMVGQRFALFQDGRLALWTRCWQGSSAALRDRLRLVRDANSPGWSELERVAAELRRRQVKDGELTCFHNSPQPLYLDLDVRPSTPFLHFGTILLFFPSRHQEIRHTLQTSRQRYVVSDLLAAGLTPAQVAADAPDSCTLPPGFPAALRSVFPWSQPVVFRAGRFVVHGVRGTVRALTSNSGEFGYE